MKIITAPDPVPMRDALGTEVFLAGSIEQGKARDWQPEVCAALEPFNALVFNPRRAVWDPTWDQDVSNAELVTQVNWELDLIDRVFLLPSWNDVAHLVPRVWDAGPQSTQGSCSRL